MVEHAQTRARKATAKCMQSSQRRWRFQQFVLNGAYYLVSCLWQVKQYKWLHITQGLLCCKSDGFIKIITVLFVITFCMVLPLLLTR
jgi:hypothetical protein